MPKRQHLLILGGSSYIGRRLFARWGPTRAVATYCTHPLEHGLYFNAISMRLAGVIKTPEAFSHAVILLGDTKPDSCAADLQRSYALNVESIKAVVHDLNRWRIKPVFASSEFVFDGTKGDYVEDDPANPILTYGKQKVEVERFLQDHCEDYVVVRFAKVFGSERGDRTLLTTWLDAIERSQTIHCAADQIFSPIHVDDVTEALIRLIEMDCHGLFHVAGPQAFSRLEILELLVARVRASSGFGATVIPCSIHDFPLREKRPLNVSMKPDKLVQTTGIRLSSIEEWCDRLVRQCGNQRDAVVVKTGGA